MPVSVRPLLIVAVVAAAVLSGCNRDREPADETKADAPAAGATSTTPVAYTSKTPYAEVELKLPPTIKAYPALHAALYADEVRQLRQFAEGAQGERTEAGFPADMPPFAKSIAIDLTFDGKRLLSLRRADYDYSGGAHPNTLHAGVLWDKAEERRLAPRDLFLKDADLSVLDQALCTAVNAAKRERAPDSPSVTLDGGDFSCPRAATTPFVLAQGDQPGQAAGLTFLIDPYQVGPYVEGAYEIDLPVSVFRSLLNPQYASEFGGRLVERGVRKP